MVKLTGPALSLRARGSIAGVLSFATLRGHAYVKRKPTVPNQNTAPQKGIRAMVRFLTTEWSGLSGGQQASFEQLATSYDVAAYHAYLKTNMIRWRRWAAPAKAHPAAEDDAAGTVTIQSTLGRVAQIVLVLNMAGVAQNWGVTIHRTTSTGFTPARNNVIFTMPQAANGLFFYVDQVRDLATYYYRAQPFSIAGKQGSMTAEKAGTAA